MNLHDSLKTRADIRPCYRQACVQSGLPTFSRGAVGCADLLFLQDIIAPVRPKNFLEVGVATGMSSSFLGRFLELHGGEAYTGIDLCDCFYGDPTKKLGFLVDELLPRPSIDFRILGGHTVHDLEQVTAGRKIDACFIDASHKHPHPLIDTLLVLPWLSDGAWIVHHDLVLWKKQPSQIGIGPQYVFDAVQDDPSLKVDPLRGNIFAFRYSGRLDDYSRIFADCLRRPWTLKQRIAPREADRMRLKLKRFYPDELVSAFEFAVEQNDRKFPVG